MSLTPKEHWRLHGTLPADVIEELIENGDSIEMVCGVEARVKEAMGQFPAEDFLSGPISRLHELAKRLRGNNRDTLIGIIESLDDIAQTTFSAADYGRSELRSAIAEINKAAQ